MVNQVNRLPMTRYGQHESFILQLWAAVFQILSWVSLFKWVRCLGMKFTQSAFFVDLWVLGHTILALATAALLPFYHAPEILNFAALIYGGLRVFEIVVYQFNVLLFDEYRASKSQATADLAYQVYSMRRLVLLLLHNYAEVIFWFAFSYRLLSRSFEFSEHQGSFIGALHASFVTMSSFSGFTERMDYLGTLIVLSQCVVGLLMTVLCLARFISLVPAPASADGTERRTDQGNHGEGSCGR